MADAISLKSAIGEEAGIEQFFSLCLGKFIEQSRWMCAEDK